MRHHIVKVTSTCLFHLRRLRKIGHILDKNSRCRLVCAFILMRIEYCNALYAELPDSTLAPLQRVLHAAVRFIVGLRARDHVTGALIELHWLPVRYRITYKLCTLMHGVVRPLTKQINKLLDDKKRNGVDRGCTKYHMGHNADCNSESTSS